MKPSILRVVLGSVLLLACANGPPPPRVATTTTTSAAVEPPSLEPASVACEGECGDVHVVAEPDYHAAAVADADRVIASMHDDLLACYRQRLLTNARAHAFVTLDVLVEESGRVRSVETSGGAMLGEATLKCLRSRVARASFAPVHGGGTLHFQIPLTLRTAGSGENI